MKRTRKEPCDGVDVGALATALVAYAKCKDDAREAFDLLSYKVKNMGDKPSPQCLVKREQLLRVVLQHSTHGRVRQTDLQQSMDLVVKLLQIKPLPTIRNEDFCCLVSHKLRVMLYDLRAKLPQTLGQTFQTVALVDQAIDCDMCFNLLASG